MLRKKKGLDVTESQFLQGAAKGLGKHEPDEDDFEGQPATIRDKPLPADVLEADRIGEGREEVCAATK
jgi:hypothetical protein